MIARRHGFALPTILIASVLTMIVLVAAITATSSIQNSLQAQQYTQLAREAAESGLAYAQGCYQKNFSSGPSALWTTAAPLMPSKNCDGSQIGSPCPSNSIEERCYVMINGNVRTTFTVGQLTTSGTVVTASVVGTTELTRSSNNEVWRTYTTTLTQSVIYDQFALSAGNDTNCAIVQGSVYCWGRNQMGQVGDGTTVNQPTPQKIGGALTGKKATTVASGLWYTCAVADNNIYCWGDNGFAQFGNGAGTPMSGGAHVLTPFPILAAKGTNSAATTSAGIAGLSGKTITELSGRDHTCAIVSGEAWCWGSNHLSQAGPVFDSTTVNITDGIGYGTPPMAVNRAPIRVGTMTNATQLSAINVSTSCFVAGGKGYCWGSGNNYMLGNGVNGGLYQTPTQVGTGVPLNNITRLEVNNGHVCATNAGKAYCWGKAGIGSFGDYRIDASITATPTTPVNLSTGVLASKTLASLAMADWTTCALTNDGQIWCWGYNNRGQLGNGTITEPTPPYGDAGGTFTATLKPQAAANATRVGGIFANSKAIKLVSGNDYFCAMTESGATYCWGSNANGTIGDGTTIDRSTPTRTLVPVRSVLF
jgi:alpha-tubulin suppressor-like RCC1 family protein